MIFPHERSGRILRQSLAALAVLATSCATLHQSYQLPIAETKSVLFDGKTLIRVSGESSGGAQIVEFLPPGEDRETWTSQAALIEFRGISDPKLWALSIVRSLQKANPRVQTAITDLSRGDGVLLDYVTWPADGSFVEFRMIQIARLGGRAVLIQHFGRRAYGKDTEGFLRSLPTERRRLVEEMTQDGLRRLRK